ncbi:F-box only protein 39-like [Physella acuta]|uniref:F-box only protein 39-like n=1 Tax=Physella acuta TaxID=109671 RepID=UPI0027DABB40|nr:F-box only protein 39-like [Physella acuta]
MSELNETTTSNTSPASDPEVRQMGEDSLQPDVDSKLEGSYLWEKLPQEVIYNIFDYLKQSDLLRLATVCKYWRDSIHTTAQFWRCMRLNLSCDKKSAHSKKSCWYATQLGSHFRELSISCHHHHKSKDCKNMAFDFRRLLLCLCHSNLTSLKITDLRLDSALISTVAVIRQVMTRMLSSYHRLHCFQMSSAQWPLHEGIKVIDTVLTVSRGTLQSLVIDGFFEATSLAQRPAEFERVTNGILSLNRLTKLGIDYQLLTDSFVTALSRSHTGQLKVLKISAGQADAAVSKIPGSVWSTLIEACPALKIAFVIDDLSSYVTIVDMLDHVLPIYKIRFLLNSTPARFESDCMCTLVVLALVMTYYRQTLVKFEMDVGVKFYGIDIAFLMFVAKCQNLLYVKASSSFTDPETEMTAQIVLQERRRQRDLRMSQDTANKRAKRSPHDGAGSSPANDTATVARTVNVIKMEAESSDQTDGLSLTNEP